MVKNLDFTSKTGEGKRNQSRRWKEYDQELIEMGSLW